MKQTWQRLEVAARTGNIDGLYSLMREDAHLLESIEKIPFVDTPLHIAASAGQVHFALEMMRLKPSFARKLNQNGYSPLHLALQNEQTTLVLRLLDVDRDLVRVQGREGKTPSHFAAEHGMVDPLAEFLSICPDSIQDLTIRKESALHVAVKSDQLESLKVLLGWLEDVGKDGVLSWCDDEGNSILHVAVSRNQIEVVNLLIARGVDVNAVNMTDNTALDIWAQQSNESRDTEIRDRLIAAGALEAASRSRNINSSVHYVRRDKRLKDAAKAGDISILYSLIREDPYILESFDDIPYAETPLHIAACLGHFNFAMEIMRWKPSFAKKPNQQGLYPIHLATINGHIQTLRQFLIFDKDLVRLQGRDGKTSLHYAAEKGDTLLLDTLLSACPPSIVDVTDQSDTALHVAIKNSQFGASYFLLTVLKTALHKGSIKQEKKVLNSKDKEGNTVLHIAVRMNEPQVVQQLLDSGVKVNVKNAEGRTALDVLGVNQAQDDTQIMRMLHKAGASNGSSVSSVAIPVAGNLTSKFSWWERLVTTIIRNKMDMSTESRNFLLVVIVLIATITYQSAVNPPKRDYGKTISYIPNSPKNSSSTNSTISCSTTNNATLSSTASSLRGYDDFLGVLFWLTNIFALSSSFLVILVILPQKYLVSFLPVPLYFFAFCFMVTTGISGSSLWLFITSISFYSAFLILYALVEISQRVKQRRLIN